MFALNAASVVWLAVAMLAWRRPTVQVVRVRERFVPAFRAGARYVVHEPVVRRILTRLTVFILPGAALWALLPVVANQRLGVGAGGYGILFGALGVGAVLGALVLGRVRTRISTNATLAAAGVLLAGALALLIMVPVFWVALVALIGAGLSWTTTISSLVAELALFLPAWVRARGMAIWTMVFTGCQAVGALLWGLIAQYAGLQATFLLAAAAALVGVAVGLAKGVPDTSRADPDPVTYWSEARVAADPDPDSGPILVSVVFTVAPDRQDAFLAAMEQLRRSRLRTGATRWELYRDAANHDRFVENFRVSSWEEHQRQHDGRLTAADREIEQTALAFSDPPARTDHLLPP